jgi:hypothetical protein
MRPAIIKKMTISFDGTSYEDWNEVKNKIDNDKDDPFSQYHPHRVKLGRGNMMSAASTQGLFTTKLDNIKNWENFERMLVERLNVTIEYCSIYGECDSDTNNP